jgi:hypothetical protein
MITRRWALSVPATAQGRRRPILGRETRGLESARGKENTMAEGKSKELDLTGLDDRAMQKVLRELDFTELARALRAAPKQVQQKVFRNTSRRACTLLKEEMSQKGADEPKRKALAVERVDRVIGRLIQAGEIRRGEATATGGRKEATAVAIDVSEPESVRESFLSLSRKARADGLLSLESDIEGMEEPFLKRGLQAVVDGTDPALVERMLRSEIEACEREGRIRIKETALQLERELADEIARKGMILDGILSIQLGDHPLILAQRIDSHRGGS